MSYLVYVEGKAPPTKQHFYLVDAMSEVERLAEQPDNRLRKIYILKVEKVNEPKITRTWASLENQ